MSIRKTIETKQLQFTMCAPSSAITNRSQTNKKTESNDQLPLKQSLFIFSRARQRQWKSIDNSPIWAQHTVQWKFLSWTKVKYSSLQIRTIVFFSSSSSLHSNGICCCFFFFCKSKGQCTVKMHRKFQQINHPFISINSKSEIITINMRQNYLLWCLINRTMISIGTFIICVVKLLFWHVTMLRWAYFIFCESKSLNIQKKNCTNQHIKSYIRGWKPNKKYVDSPTDLKQKAPKKNPNLITQPNNWID